MNKQTKLYLHLALSFAVIPIESYNMAALKLLFMIYAIWLTSKKDAYYLPALVVICSFLTSSYIVYLTMIVMSVINFKTIKQYNLQFILVILLMLLPFTAFFTITRLFTLGLSSSEIKTGAIINQFQLYFTLFSFFYGILIFKSIDRHVIKALIITFVITIFSIIIIRSFSDLRIPRLLFFIIPLFLGSFSYILFNRRSKGLYFYFVVSIILIIQSILTSGGTFTLLTTSLFVILLSTLYYKNKLHLLMKITGAAPFIVMLVLLWYSISNFGIIDYSIYRGMEMKDITSFESLYNRFLMKFFEDRASLWSSSWSQIVLDKNWLPPLKVVDIQYTNRFNKTSDFEFHSHNILLELIRNFGFIMGGTLSIIYAYFIILGRKIFSIPNINPIFVMLIATAVSTMIIGGMTGIFVLLPSYAVLGLSLLSVAYAHYFRLKDKRVYNAKF